MNVRFTAHPSAERELNEAAAHYGRIGENLRTDFLDEIERCVRAVRDQPRASALVAPSVRRRLANRFPYAVVYRVKPDEIRILAIAHLKRRPFYRAGRV